MTATIMQWNNPLPDIDNPILIVHLSGWIDSGGAAQLATDTLLRETGADPIAVFDDDAYLDYRARRPTMRLVEGRNTVLAWQQITLSHGRDQVGRDLVILHGPEPDMRWHAFIAEVAGAAERLNVTSCAHLGAYPFACPHTRPSRLSVTTASEDLLTRVPFLRSTLDVPAGVGSALEHELHSLGIPTLGIWAQVPHYAAGLPYPPSAVALLDGLRTSCDVVVDAADLRRSMVDHRKRLDDLVAANSEHASMLTQLEIAHDATPGHATVSELPNSSLQQVSAEELGEAVERFLRGDT